MIRYGITFEGTVVGSWGADQLDKHLDEVMEELIRLDVEDPSVNATLATGSVEISLVIATVEAPNPEIIPDAVRRGLNTIRSAIHAAGGVTPDWPDELSPDEWGIAFEETSIRKADGALV